MTRIVRSRRKTVIASSTGDSWREDTGSAKMRSDILQSAPLS